jgi:hypothetical protein
VCCEKINRTASAKTNDGKKLFDEGVKALDGKGQEFLKKYKK